jgi:hypothetical protein
MGKRAAPVEPADITWTTGARPGETPNDEDKRKDQVNSHLVRKVTRVNLVKENLFDPLDDLLLLRPFSEGNFLHQ